VSTSDRRLFKRLPPVQRGKILGYLQEQSYEKWVYIRDILVSPGVSLYDMVDVLDRDWPGMYPSAILVARTSQLIDQRNKDLEALEI
jgi:hypothetical protein